MTNTHTKDGTPKRIRVRKCLCPGGTTVCYCKKLTKEEKAQLLDDRLHDLAKILIDLYVQKRTKKKELN